jgi:hypothetical protein
MMVCCSWSTARSMFCSTVLEAIYASVTPGNLNNIKYSYVPTEDSSSVLLVRGISQSQGLYLHTGQHKQDKSTHTTVPRVGFEPTTPVFQRDKTVHALDYAATVVGTY